MAKRKPPHFWFAGLSNKIYMTHAYREDAKMPGVMVCTGEKYDVTEAVLAVAKRYAKESVDS